MATVAEELTVAVCEALKTAGLLNEAEATKLKQKISGGKIKPEDWYSAIERSLPKQEVSNG